MILICPDFFLILGNGHPGSTLNGGHLLDDELLFYTYFFAGKVSEESPCFCLQNGGSKAENKNVSIDARAIKFKSSISFLEGGEYVQKLIGISQGQLQTVAKIGGFGQVLGVAIFVGNL